MARKDIPKWIQEWTEMGTPPEASKIIDCMKRAGLKDAQIGPALEEWMNENPISGGTSAQKMTLEQLIALMDQGDDVALKAAWDKLSDENKAELKAAILAASKTQDSAAKPDAIANHQISRLQQVISSKQTSDQKKVQIKEILHALMGQRMDLLRSDAGKPYIDKIVQILAKGKLFGMNRDGYIDQVTDRVKKLVPLRESHVRTISKILKSSGLTWKDIGYTQVLNESINGIILFEKIDNIVNVESIILESMKPILKKFK